MADLKRFKRESLGAPPPPTEAPANLRAPETAPSAAPVQREAERPFKDGRSARRTGRTFQFSTRVSAAFNERFRTIAERDRLQMNELLEKALDAYEDSAEPKGQGAG
jgi:hypothetical protein